MHCTTVPEECRLDWLTVTCHKPERRLPFVNLSRELLKLSESQGGLARPWHWKRYRGAHAGGVTWGTRDDSDILQLSGPYADEWFDTVWTNADNCTRVDLAVTVKIGDGIGELLRSHEAEAIEAKRAKGTGPNVSLIGSEGVPATLYLGTRVSDLFARIYDKGLESGEGDYSGYLRYELEIKGDPALSACTWLHSAGDRPSRIRNALFQHLTRRGIQPRFSCVGEPVRIKAVRPRSDTTTRLAWLSSTVRPTTQALIAKGLWREVFDALELPRSLSEQLRLGQALERGHHKDWLQSEWSDESADSDPC